jgi:hypothetical protein
MKEIYNPSMQEEPFDHPTRIIPPRQEQTMLGWLEQAGRLIAQETDAEDHISMPDNLVDEITEAESYQDDDDNHDDEDED